MTLIRQSRILKAFTDRGIDSFDGALARLAAVHLVFTVSRQALTTAAGQACLVSGVAAACKTFSNVSVLLEHDAVLMQPLPCGYSISGAVRSFGAHILHSLPGEYTHGVAIGTKPVDDGRFWGTSYWDGWHAGIRAVWEPAEIGESWNPLAGTFAAAIAVREVFAQVLGRNRPTARSCTVDLWRPFGDLSGTRGPEVVYLPKNLIMVGLGHLGQGFLWNLMQLPGRGNVIGLQDYQRAADENIGTGLITSARQVGMRKTRVAAEFVDSFGWDTALLEFGFSSGSTSMRDTAPVIISGLDSVTPREWIREAGYPYMLDIGVGHGPVDFEFGQIRCLPAGSATSWTAPAEAKDAEQLRDSASYVEEKKRDPCGALALAEASVAVPFVGLAMGALAVGQTLRIGAMETTNSLMQFELGTPELATAAAKVDPLSRSLGAREINLRKRTSTLE